MPQYTSLPMSIAAARAYVDWTSRMATGVSELVADGSIPAIPNMEQLMAHSKEINEVVLASARAAEGRGEDTCQVTLDFDDAEKRLLIDFGMTLVSYVEILTIRGKIDGTITPQTMEAMTAMQSVMG